jgi:RHS repeat-associated protein
LGIKHLFQGQLWTQETGLNDYRNRVELPAMGVFLQPDPLGFKCDAANIYRFCGNDPVDRTDPLGLMDNSAWTRLMLWQGSLPWSVSELLTAIAQQQSQPAGNQSSAVASHDEGVKVHFTPASNPVYHEDDVYRNNKDGSTTKVASKTTAELEETADSAKDVTVKLTVREYYANSAGPKTKDFAAKHEHKDNAQPILDWYRVGSTQLKAILATRQGFGSSEALRQAVDGAIGPGFKTVRDRAQMAADVAGLHNPRDERGYLIPYDQ